MEQIIIGGIIFVVCVILIELLIYAVKNARSPNRARIRKRLRKFAYIEEGIGDSDILRKRVLSEIPFLNNLLLKTPGVLKLDNLIIKANARFPMGFYILLALLLAALGFLFGTVVVKNAILALIFIPFFGFSPFFYLILLRQKRMQRMRKQMVEALDLISRALKAGHAFTGGLRLAADEFDDPLGPEFAETLDEINFGVSVPEALKNLARRMDCSEIKYFVVGVILQRETGGNLAELMDTLANLIRERFKFDGKVKTLSAEGKLSAVVLICLPFVIIAYLKLTQPNYMNLLFTDPIGRVMALVAAILMIIGIFIMTRMVKIEV
ncbi:MAG: type II secretion system F family protein [Desulfobacteraceae bacterium]|jgi:tight adherence protein B